MLAKYYVTPWLAIEAGPEVDFLVSAKLGGAKVKDAYKGTTLSFPIGISFEPYIKNESFVFDLRYVYGLTKANKYGEGMHNSSFLLTIGYKLNFSR